MTPSRFSLNKVAPVAAPNASLSSTCVGKEDNDQSDPKECIFVTKDVSTQLYIKKASDRRRLRSFQRQSTGSTINRALYHRVLNSDLETVAYIRYDKHVKSIVLLDEANHEAFVLCLPHGNSLVIFSRRPRTANCDVLSIVQYDGDSFYPWLKVSNMCDVPTFHVWNGQSFAGPTKAPFAVFREKKHQDCDNEEKSLLKITSGDHVLCFSSRGKDPEVWNVHLAAGADPATMLMLSAVLTPEMLRI